MDALGFALLPALAYLLLVLTPAVTPCTPLYPEPTVEEQVTRAQVVVYGKVLRQLPGMGYTAEMLVYCVLKEHHGEHVGPVINVTMAGFIPGLCYGSDLQPGEEYIVLLRTNPDKTFSPRHSPDNSVKLSDPRAEVMLRSCALHPHVPDLPVAMHAGMSPPQRKPCPRTNCPLDAEDNHDHGEGHYHGDGHDEHDHGEDDHDNHGHGEEDHDDHDHGEDGHDNHDHGEDDHDDHDHGEGHYHGDGHDEHDHGEDDHDKHDHGEGHYHGDGHDEHDHGDEENEVGPKVGQSVSGDASYIRSSCTLMGVILLLALVTL